MGLAGFTGSGSDARVWRIAAADKPDRALRLASSPAAHNPTLVQAQHTPANQHLLPHGSPVEAIAHGTATVLPLLAGGSLLQRLAATGPLTPWESMVVLVSMREALAVLHEVGLVHLDVSPSNIMFGADGCPVLTDTTGVQRADGRSCRRGTPPYTVPGVAASPSTDWIALGRVITELVSGSALTPPTRLPDMLRAPVDALSRGVDPSGTFPEIEPAQRVLDVLPDGHYQHPNQRSTIDFIETSPEPVGVVSQRPNRAAVLAAIAILVGLAAFPVTETTNNPRCDDGSDLVGTDLVDADLIHVDVGRPCTLPVLWSQESGVMLVPTSAGPQRFGIGQPGDQLSFGDWDCDGSITPALTRGERFYVFDSWPQDSPAIATEWLAGPRPCSAPSTRRGG